MERRRSRQPPIRPLILLADGHADTGELYATTLPSLGFETATIGDGANACTQAWLTHPDVVVTEIRLPSADGWDVVRDIRRHPRTRDIPIVIVTADGRPAVRGRAHREGCAALMVKPCTPEVLASELRHVLKLQPASADPRPAH